MIEKRKNYPEKERGGKKKEIKKHRVKINIKSNAKQRKNTLKQIKREKNIPTECEAGKPKGKQGETQGTRDRKSRD